MEKIDTLKQRLSIQTWDRGKQVPRLKTNPRHQYIQGGTQLKYFTSQSGRQILNFTSQMINLPANKNVREKNIYWIRLIFINIIIIIRKSNYTYIFKNHR